MQLLHQHVPRRPCSSLPVPVQNPRPSPQTQADEVLPQIHTYLDFVGFLLSAAAVVVLLVALELGGDALFYKSPVVIRTFCGSAGALGALIAWNYHKGDNGLIPPSMAGKRPVWCAAATNFTLVGSAMIQIYLHP
ncbi:efflux pump [Colletotrichum graminicola]|nr:efflux pump [Colletotrichum graminicola]